MGSAVKLLPHYTYDDYRLWEGKWEIIEGIPYAMSPAPVPKHQYIANNVGGELRNLLKASGSKRSLRARQLTTKLRRIRWFSLMYFYIVVK